MSRLRRPGALAVLLLNLGCVTATPHRVPGGVGIERLEIVPAAHAIDVELGLTLEGRARATTSGTLRFELELEEERVAVGIVPALVDERGLSAHISLLHEHWSSQLRASARVARPVRIRLRGELLLPSSAGSEALPLDVELRRVLPPLPGNEAEPERRSR